MTFDVSKLVSFTRRIAGREVSGRVIYKEYMKGFLTHNDYTLYATEDSLGRVTAGLITGFLESPSLGDNVTVVLESPFFVFKEVACRRNAVKKNRNIVSLPTEYRSIRRIEFVN